MKSKGYRSVTIKGIEGRVKFKLERYESKGDFFSLSNQFKSGLESKGLKNWIRQELPHKSYAAVSESLEMLSGAVLYSSNHLSEKAKIYAKEVSESTIKTYDGMQLFIPFSEPDVAIYDSESREILLFDSDRRCGCHWCKATERKADKRLQKSLRNGTK